MKKGDLILDYLLKLYFNFFLLEFSHMKLFHLLCGLGASKLTDCIPFLDASLNQWTNLIPRNLILAQSE